MRTREEIDGDMEWTSDNRACQADAFERDNLKLEVLLDIRDLLKTLVELGSYMQ